MGQVAALSFPYQAPTWPNAMVYKGYGANIIALLQRLFHWKGENLTPQTVSMVLNFSHCNTVVAAIPMWTLTLCPIQLE